MHCCALAQTQKLTKYTFNVKLYYTIDELNKKSNLSKKHCIFISALLVNNSKMYDIFRYIFGQKDHQFYLSQILLLFITFKNIKRKKSESISLNFWKRECNHRGDWTGGNFNFIKIELRNVALAIKFTRNIPVTEANTTEIFIYAECRNKKTKTNTMRLFLETRVLELWKSPDFD